MKDSNQSSNFPDLDKSLNTQISKLNEYCEKLLNEINRANIKNNSDDELLELINDLRTKVNSLGTETLNEEE